MSQPKRNTRSIPRNTVKGVMRRSGRGATQTHRHRSARRVNRKSWRSELHREMGSDS